MEQKLECRDVDIPETHTAYIKTNTPRKHNGHLTNPFFSPPGFYKISIVSLCRVCVLPLNTPGRDRPTPTAHIRVIPGAWCVASRALAVYGNSVHTIGAFTPGNGVRECNRIVAMRILDHVLVHILDSDI